MNTDIWYKVERLVKCSFLPGSWDKRFVRTMFNLGPDAELTGNQIKWVKILWHRYRVQLGHNDKVDFGIDYSDLRQVEYERKKLDEWIKAVGEEQHRR